MRFLLFPTLPSRARILPWVNSSHFARQQNLSDSCEATTKNSWLCMTVSLIQPPSLPSFFVTCHEHHHRNHHSYGLFCHTAGSSGAIVPIHQVGGQGHVVCALRSPRHALFAAIHRSKGCGHRTARTSDSRERHPPSALRAFGRQRQPDYCCDGRRAERQECGCGENRRVAGDALDIAQRFDRCLVWRRALG